MAIVQEDRFNAPQPEVETTDYGVQYVKAATETPVNEPVVLDPVDDDSQESNETVETANTESPASPAEEKPKKKGGRPKKDAKK